MTKKKTAPHTRKRKLTMAQRADRHVLYEKAVQDADAECAFVDLAFRHFRKRVPFTLREDFCGTANVSGEWVKGDPKRRAIGVDLDPAVLQWARDNTLPKLTPEQRKRVRLLQDDVLTVKCARTDVALAMNFSFQVLKTRDLMLRYFRHVREGLVRDGIFFIDLFGGSHAFREMRERTRHRGFSYIWDQARHNPVTGDITCHIHFAFPDGSRLNNAFTYDWRLWTLPELRDIMIDAGFREVVVFWQGTDEKTGDFNGVFAPATEAEADPAWIAFLAALK